MGYGRLGSTEPHEIIGGQSPESSRLAAAADATDSSPSPPPPTRSRRRKLLSLILSLLSVTLLAASAVMLVRHHHSSSSTATFHHRNPTVAISKTCSKTRFPTLCVNSLLDFPGSLSASEPDLVHISFNLTLRKFGHALYASSELANLQMDPYVRSAYEDCLELLEDSIDALSRSLVSVSPPGTEGGGATAANPRGGSTQDVLTWLSAALTNQDTCNEGLEGVKGSSVKGTMMSSLKDLSELVSNCLAIYSASNGDDFSGVPIQNKRRRLMNYFQEEEDNAGAGDEFPKWLERRDRKLLSMPLSSMNIDIIVSPDGNGTVKTIAEAIKKAPEYSTRRTIIWIRQGKYEEKILKVGRKKTNLMFIGDGIGKTVISGGKSVFDNMTTFHTASFAATGAGFIAVNITFVNWAGPARHQAVALRVGADHAVVYKCQIIGYQDTLYVHSQRQFFRECDIYGTVDFIFGNAAVVFQNCSMVSQKPMPFQKNTITAQNRKDPNQNTGMSIHACRILATKELQASEGNFSTYLGRPWKLYSRTVYMQTYMGDHIHPRGWLEWNSTFALDTLYYGEYMNYGPGGAVGQRVQWPGYRVITSPVEANKFTVSQFIYGSSWLPSTGIAFLGGLSS